MEVPDVIVKATIQMLKDLLANAEKNTEIGILGPSVLVKRTEKNIEVLELLQDKVVRAPIPIAAISNIVNEVIELASKNGADSRSMPDDYVAVAHFVCYPQEYQLQIEGVLT